MAKSIDSNQALDPQFFQKIISESDPGITINSVEITTGAGRGDNYTSMLYRVQAKGFTIQGNLWTKSFICKILPINRERREAFKSDSLFKNEVAFYTRALPALISFQEKQGHNIFNYIPKVYLAKSNILVLEDLKTKGFTMADRKKTLDLHHCEAILTSLGHFHGLSYALKFISPDVFKKEVMDEVSECLFREENEAWYTEYYHKAGENATVMLRERLQGSGMVDNNKYIEKFKNFMNRDFFRRMITQIQPCEPTAVLCHGDCWTNNFLFKYSEPGKISELCMVDFQFARYGSPALDIVYLLFNCTTLSLRSNLRHLLITYTSALKNIMLRSGCSTDTLGSCDIIQIMENEIRHCSGVGLGLAVEMIPICTCSSEEAPDLYIQEPNTAADELSLQNIETEADIEKRKTVERSEETLRSREECKIRITDLIVELVDANLI